MDKTEFNEAIKAIGTCEDEVQRRSLLLELEENVSSIFDSNSELTELNTKLSEANESLKSDNMKLFLKVGETKTEAESFKDKTGLEKPKEKLKFEDLFDDKGGLK